MPLSPPSSLSPPIISSPDRTPGNWKAGWRTGNASPRVKSGIASDVFDDVETRRESNCRIFIKVLVKYLPPAAAVVRVYGINKAARCYYIVLQIDLSLAPLIAPTIFTVVITR